METLWNAFKTLAPWQILVLVVVLFGAAGATYGGYARGNGPSLEGLAENQQLIPVKYGDLVNEITTSGNLTFANRETLVFGSQGTVVEVLVEEGWPVVKGQVLAKLDRSAVASLEQGVAQAEFDWENAKETLEDVKLLDPLEMAQAQEKVANAGFQVQEAVEALDDAKEPYTQQDIDTQHKFVADTRLALQVAKLDLADLAREHAILVALARQTKADAKLAEDSAQQALADFARQFTQELAEARQAKADAEFALDNARGDLTDYPRVYSDELAEARQAQADAELVLDRAQEDLVDYLPDYDQELAGAREGAAKAATALDEAEQTRADFVQEHSRQLAQARQDEPVALAALKEAQDSLDSYEDRNSRRLSRDREQRAEIEADLEEIKARLASAIRSAEGGLMGLDLLILRLQGAIDIRQDILDDVLKGLAEVLQLEAAVEVAQRLLEKAQLDLARLEAGPDPIKERELESAVDVAKTNLETVNLELARLEQGPDPLQRQDLEAAVELAQANLDRVLQDLAELEQGPDPLRRKQLQTFAEVAQAKLTEVEEVLADVEARGSPQAVALQETKVLGASEFVRSAEEALKASGPGEPELSSREARLALAHANLLAAEEILAAITAGADPLELALREAGLSLAQANSAKAEQDLAELGDGPDPLDVASKKAEVARLTAAMAQAEEDLAELLAGPDSLEVTLREGQLALARETLAEAEEDLAEFLAGPDLLEVALREAEVASAQMALLDAQQRLVDSAIKAPFGGFVSVVSVENGDEVQANTPIVEVVDPSVVEVDGIVDEIDVLSVRQGSPVGVTVDALPGRTLKGTVTEISPGAQNQQGVVTYPIRIRVEVPEGLDLREGLTAVANIVLREERNVLLLPQQALYGTFEEPVVKVLNGDGVIEERSVVLGNSDDFWVAVRAGLKEGDQVAMESGEVGTDRFSFRQFRRVTGVTPGRGRSGGGSRGGRR